MRKFSFMDISREDQEVLVAMGVAVLLLQSAEKVLRICMTFVLQNGSPLTLDALQAQEEAERNKALGYFLTELRRRTTLEYGFDALLKEFLKNRNDFVHDLSRVHGWGLSSTGQTEDAKRFVHRLIEQAETVIKVFAGLIRAWQQQIGMPEPVPVAHPWFEEIEQMYRPLAHRLFFAKDQHQGNNKHR
jgi:hypothetical protein